MNYRYLAPGGAALFKKDTSKTFTKRNNAQLLVIDKALVSWANAHGVNDDNETEALLRIVTAASEWLDGKKGKVSTNSSFRMRHVSLVYGEARDRLMSMRTRRKAEEDRLWTEHQALVRAQNERRAAEQQAASDKAAKDLADKQRKFGQAKGEMLRLANTMQAPGGTARELQANNQLEAQDPDHHAGHLLRSHFNRWKTSSTKLSFWEWLKTIDGNARKELEDNKVAYLDDLVFRSLFEVVFDESGRMMSAMSPAVQKMILDKRTKHDVFAAAPLELLDTTSWPSRALRGLTDGWAAAVLSTDDVLYAGVHTAGVFHHSSFLCGAPVKAACMLKVAKGELAAIHEKNGHYQARTEEIMRLVAFLQLKMPRTNWSQVQYHPFNTNEPPVTASEMLVRSGRPRPLPPRPVAAPYNVARVVTNA